MPGGTALPQFFVFVSLLTWAGWCNVGDTDYWALALRPGLCYFTFNFPNHTCYTCRSWGLEAKITPSRLHSGRMVKPRFESRWTWQLRTHIDDNLDVSCMTHHLRFLMPTDDKSERESRWNSQGQVHEVSYRTSLLFSPYLYFLKGCLASTFLGHRWLTMSPSFIYLFI